MNGWTKRERLIFSFSHFVEGVQLFQLNRALNLWCFWWFCMCVADALSPQWVYLDDTGLQTFGEKVSTGGAPPLFTKTWGLLICAIMKWKHTPWFSNGNHNLPPQSSILSPRLNLIHQSDIYGGRQPSKTMANVDFLLFPVYFIDERKTTCTVKF